MIRGIRGAVTVSEDTVENVKTATVELLSKMIEVNNLNTEDFVTVNFSITTDIKSATPAKFARTELGWNTVPMMCYREFEFDGGLNKCIRVLIVTNSDKTQKELVHVYLGEAKILRPDLRIS
ncbi:MAG: chorismate mutase [Candidatus Gastranaerophilaceae bacterium]